MINGRRFSMLFSIDFRALPELLKPVPSTKFSLSLYLRLKSLTSLLKTDIELISD